MKRIETWWVVQTKKVSQPRLPWKYLQLKNASDIRRRPTLRSGRLRPKKWALGTDRFRIRRFDSLKEARAALRCKLLKDWVVDGNFVEIVEVTGDRRKMVDRNRTQVVVERPGCPPLLALALEAA